jgi:hypothetical protein
MIPMRAIMVGPSSSTTRRRQAGDAVAGIAQSHGFAPPGSRTGSSKRRAQTATGFKLCDQLSAFRDVLSAQLAFFSAASTAALFGQIAALS